MAEESIFDRVTRQVAQQAATGVMNRIPAKAKANLPLAKILLSGDINKIGGVVADRVLGADFKLKNIFPPELGVGLQYNSPLLGGINMKKAREIFDQTSRIDYAKRNLWHLSIVDLKTAYRSGDRDVSKTEFADGINLFATNVSYAPITITGDAIRVGSGSFDTVQQGERVEMRVATLDDDRGTLKRWFAERASIVVKPDGTHGLPIDYLMAIKVTHAYIDPDISGADDGEIRAYTDSFIMRPGSTEYDLDRRTDDMQELQMSFVQFDTFTGLQG